MKRIFLRALYAVLLIWGVAGVAYGIPALEMSSNEWEFRISYIPLLIWGIWTADLLGIGGRRKDKDG